MPYNQTDFSLEHYCNGQKSHFRSEGSCHLQKPAGLSRNLLEEERMKNALRTEKYKRYINILLLFYLLLKRITNEGN